MATGPGDLIPPVPRALAADHGRQWRDFDYIYPVISRRSRGLSVGINLNVDGACNFDCMYCQVDRTHPPARRDVDMDQLGCELSQMIRAIIDGSIWSDAHLAATPLPLRRFADIAFSGNGEPTASPLFARACELVKAVRQDYQLSATKIVVITNATRLDQPQVQQALDSLGEDDWEIWAKLDAGTEDYFRRVDRPRSGVDLARITQNIIMQSMRKPVVIQSMFLAIDGQPPLPQEFAAYLQRLAMMIEAGAQISRVQMYTIARRTAESNLSPLNHLQMDSLANQLHTRLAELECEVFYAPD